MSDMLGNMTMSMYGDRLRMWGMGGGGIDTKSLVEVELSMLEMKKYPVESQKSFITQEKTYWQDFKTTLTNFQSVVEKLKKVSDSNKQISLSQEGYANVTASKEALEATYSLEVKNVASAHKILSDSQGNPTVAMEKEGTIKINNKELVLTTDMSLNDFITKINEGGYGINATAINGTLVLTAKNTGEENAIVFEDSSEGGVLEQLGLITSEGDIKNEIQQAKDAVFKLDGVEVTSAKNNVSDIVTGVTINLVKETTSPISFTVNKNEKVLKEAVSEFVSMYNKTIARINQHTAKGSILQGKSIVNQAKSDLNRSLTEPTDSNLMLFQIGIQLDGVLKDGTIRLDEKKLTDMLESNYEEVSKMLIGENGFASKLFAKVDLLTKSEGTIATKIDGLDRNIKSLDETLAKYEVSFARQRESILEKYARFETMMAQLSIQDQFMTAQLEAMNGTKK